MINIVKALDATVLRVLSERRFANKWSQALMYGMADLICMGHCLVTQPMTGLNTASIYTCTCTWDEYVMYNVQQKSPDPLNNNSPLVRICTLTFIVEPFFIHTCSYSLLAALYVPAARLSTYMYVPAELKLTPKKVGPQQLLSVVTVRSSGTWQPPHYC